MDRDREFLYVLSTAPENGWRWRFRGGTPSPEAFAAHMWDGVLAQFIAEDRVNRTPIGATMLYNFNSRGNTVYFGVVARPDVHHTGALMEASVLMLAFAFRVWDLRKVYAEALDFNLHQFASVRRYFTEEGRLREHEYHDGGYVDLVTLALDRTTWDTRCKALQQYCLDQPDIAHEAH